MSKDFLSTVMSYALYKKEMRDDRGLVPIEEARQTLDGFESFENGELIHFGEECCTESDRVFASLCSLDNADEFLKVIMGKPWNFPTRMDLICALAERYGEEIMPWLETMVDETNNFPDKGYSSCPPHLHDCLYLLNGDEATELAFKIDRPKDKAKTPYFLSWLERKPEREAWFLDKVNAGDERAKSLYDFREKQFAQIPEVKKVLKEAEKIKAKKGPSLSYTRLQEHFDNNGVPSWIPYSEFCGAMTISGFVDPEKGDCLVIQTLIHNNTYEGIHRDTWKIGGMDNPFFSPITNSQIVPLELLYDEEGEPILEGEIHVSSIDASVPVAVNTEGLSEEQTELLDFEEPESIIAIRLGQEFRDKVFLQDEALKREANLSEKAIELFRFDGFQLPDFEGQATDSLDFIAMLEALKKRKAIKTLPSNYGALDSLLEALEEGLY